MPANPPPLRNLIVIGLGHIGASLALAAGRGGAAGRVIGHDNNAATLRRARRLGIATAPHLAAAVRRASGVHDMIVLAVPPLAAAAMLPQMAPAMAAGATLTDVCSVKRPLIDALQQCGHKWPRLVLAHPLAGTENSGIAHADAALFAGALCLVSPLAGGMAAALRRVRRLWRDLGARTEILPAADHDRILSATSHLPHLLSFALVGALARSDDGERIFRYAGGGFRDFTRIAASCPRMWHDVFMGNRRRLGQSLGMMERHLARFKRAVERGDGGALMQLITEASDAGKR